MPCSASKPLFTSVNSIRPAYTVCMLSAVNSDSLVTGRWSVSVYHGYCGNLVHDGLAPHGKYPTERVTASLTNGPLWRASTLVPLP